MKIIIPIFIGILILFSCSPIGDENTKEVSDNNQKAPFLWENATVYFLMTDRFYNGDTTNDFSFNRERDGAKLRNFMGGDIKGITEKIKDGYFNKLGINAIWLTPPVEQVHGSTDEGTGKTYGYHGYWTRDWTCIDPNFGTWEDLEKMVDIAHKNKIRIILDVVLNHTGPEIPGEPAWPESWVRTSPTCTYQDYETTISCTLVENLPDIRTGIEDSVGLPEFLIQKWEKEGRLETELEELNSFFSETGYPRAPKYYIIKWLTDFIREMGIDGFRVDTAKHTEPEVWAELWEEVVKAFHEWKAKHPEKVIDDTEFFMMGEVYGFNIYDAPMYNFGDTTVNFYDVGFKSLINFSFKNDAGKPMEELFSIYSDKLNTALNGKTVMNYISSHDDSQPFDISRTRVFESAAKLLLSPGMVQIYYGDETARPLEIEGTRGDAHLRSFMNWDELENNTFKNGYNVQDVLDHWSKLTNFRKEHPAVGIGVHRQIKDSPYTFTREIKSHALNDLVMVIIENTANEIVVDGIFQNGIILKDFYSGQISQVKDEKVFFEELGEIVLLAEMK